jgi:anthranilate synthase component 2
MKQAYATQTQRGGVFFGPHPDWREVQGRNGMTARMLVIDNFDSFTFNLVQMFRRYDLAIDVFRSDAIGIEAVRRHAPDYVLVSPGPRDPAHAGISKRLIATFYAATPILGVCLGMQCINEVFGGETIRAPVPMHGKTSRIHHEATGIFTGMPERFVAARYHSLAIAPAAEPLEVNATADDGVIMGICHPRHPLHGVQFHPESFLTEHGFTLVENFLKLGPLEAVLT